LDNRLAYYLNYIIVYKKKNLLTEIHIRITLLNYFFNSINKQEDAAKWCNYNAKVGNIMQKLQQGLRKLTTIFFVKQATYCTKYADFHKLLSAYFNQIC